MNEIRTVGLVGTGVIGAGWAARLLFHGIDVVAYDPASNAEARLRDAIDRAWVAMKNLDASERSSGGLRFLLSLEELCSGVDFVQESAPEREDLKRALLARIDALVPPEVIIASSSSGLLPSRLQADCRHPERIVVGHPFNPVYLLPLVEVLGGERTDPTAIERATTFYTTIGMQPLRVRREVEGYISDRLQEALWREALHMVADGVATTEEIDAAITRGPGLRWAFMGVCLTFHLAGGEGGMRHMLEQFGPALELPWTTLPAPPLTDTLTERLIEGTQGQAAGRSVRELERLRDNTLVAILKTLQCQKETV